MRLESYTKLSMAGARNGPGYPGRWGRVTCAHRPVLEMRSQGLPQVRVWCYNGSTLALLAFGTSIHHLVCPDEDETLSKQKGPLEFKALYIAGKIPGVMTSPGAQGILSGDRIAFSALIQQMLSAQNEQRQAAEAVFAEVKSNANLTVTNLLGLLKQISGH